MSIKDKAGRLASPALGLLAGCGIAFMGACRNMEPDVILFRAAVGGLVCGIVAAITRFAIRFFSS